MSSAITDALERAIQSLISEGKEPSVALVKARLREPLPIPVIIQALKSWKQHAQLPDIPQAKAKPLNDQARIAQLESQVAELTERLAALEQRIAS
ncbi:hypothetical protein [Photobacterium sp. 1_MG-2023]|uniref:hypothetical protein n=1 Tax=Photobacterium sp. 1_MG-2023 TaxID=3062646 RepID=UPI0026E48FAB|nr:hypothetical protein [Photobacterium sp. 1_MG-2023]MDO6707788.1 hypothetical protein [Photobacterium sp. 1_MG-2023]